MIEMHYEHHNKLRTDKICPFLVSKNHNSYDGICNWHTNPEIIFIIDGKGFVQYGSDTIEVSRDDIVVVNRECIHRVYSTEGVSFCYIITDESFCRENGIDLTASTFNKIIRDGKTLSLCNCAAERVLEYKQVQTVVSAVKARAAILELFADLLERHVDNCSQPASAKRISEVYVKKVISYLSVNYNMQTSLDELARICGVTKYHLAREFKSYTGQTVFNYVNMIRCKKAEICLARGMTVTATAFECGFYSVSYFSRTYKKFMGKSPSNKG